MRNWFSLILAANLLAPIGAACVAESIPKKDLTGRPTQRTGLLTDRLNKKQLQVWRAMEQIAGAKDQTGQPLYPSLHELYIWAQTSGFSIGIEMPQHESISPYEAAECVLEQTPSGMMPRLTIRIYVGVIDKARVERTKSRAGDFIPFRGLSGVARYCESLAHELTHARQWLTDPAYAQLLREQEALNAQFLELVHRKAKDHPARQKKLELQHRLTEMGNRIEASAITAEKQVWRELTSSPMI
ncbi:MAG: hypothetical protein EHM18_12785 [Acidobacteria bacterium]|nr:MAG: hypothetical protein EHM18_12785 [Acidobacteriota bacterium]